jgi:hypothetical protein
MNIHDVWPRCSQNIFKYSTLLQIRCEKCKVQNNKFQHMKNESTLGLCQKQPLQTPVPMFSTYVF